MRVGRALLVSALVLLLVTPALAQDEAPAGETQPGAADLPEDITGADTSAPAPAAPDSGSNVAPACTIDTPFPPDLKITPAPADLPPELSAFSGVWEGTWDFGLPARIAVTQISGASAVIYYSYGATAHLRGGFDRYDAQVLPGNRLDLRGGQLRFTFAMRDDLQAITGADPQGSRIQLTRCAAPEPPRAPTPVLQIRGTALGFTLPLSATAADVGVIDNVGVTEAPNAVQQRDLTSPVRGALFKPAQITRPLPGVLMLHGSGGYDSGSTPGLLGAQDMARHLAAQGFVVLRLCYFGCSGRPQQLERIELEYVLSAVRYLEGLPDVDGANVSVWGFSRGAELALLIGSLSPDLRSVIALYGPSTAREGCCAPTSGSICAWTLRGACVPVGTRTPVEKIHGPVLLLHGQYDALSPLVLQQMTADQLDAAPHPYQLTIFKDVGHAFGYGLACLVAVRLCQAPTNIANTGQPEASYWDTIPWDAAAYVEASRVSFAQTVAFLKALAAQPAQ